MTSSFIYNSNLEIPNTEFNMTVSNNFIDHSDKFNIGNQFTFFQYKTPEEDDWEWYRLNNIPLIITAGSSFEKSDYSKVNNTNKVTKYIWNRLSNMKKNPVTSKTKEILYCIDKIINNSSIDRLDIYSFPPISINELSDGAIILEWFFDHFRIAFNIEVDLPDSSWYIISDEKYGNYIVSAYLNGDELSSTIAKIIRFISTGSL